MATTMTSGITSDAAPTMTDDQVRAEAGFLDRAERTATQIRQTTSVHPDATIGDAYRIQDTWLRLRLERGERAIGHKIGLTSRAMKAAMNITTPDSGFLTDAMVIEPDSGSTSAPMARSLSDSLPHEVAVVTMGLPR